MSQGAGAVRASMLSVSDQLLGRLWRNYRNELVGNQVGRWQTHFKPTLEKSLAEFCLNLHSPGEVSIWTK